MTDNPWLAAVVTLFAWWFSTGVILWRVRVADNGGAQDHLNSVIMGLPLLAIGAAAGLALSVRLDPVAASVPAYSDGKS